MTSGMVSPDAALLLDQCLNDTPVRAISAAFARHGQEVYLVGGAIRDCLLGRRSTELDFATSALPATTLEIARQEHLGAPYRVGEKYGTIGIRQEPWTFEITTYRSAERYEPGSRKPRVRFGGSIAEDLLRRDFTINAIALDPKDGRVVDPVGGMADLRAGVIRAVGYARDRFEEDPLRLLRAVRFATRLGFALDPDTRRALADTGDWLAAVSRERIRDEIGAILIDDRAPAGLTLLRDTGLLGQAVPLLTELTRMPDHGPRHPLSLWDHTMRVVARVPSRLAVRWAALLHDIGKPRTRTHEPSGRPRFFHHEEVGAKTARAVLEGLRYPRQFVDSVVLLVETHMQLHAYSDEWSDGAVRRLMIRLGDHIEDALTLARADAAGHTASGRSQNAVRFDAFERRMAALDRAQVAALRSPLSGFDLMQRYQDPPGPWIGEIKNVLEDAVLEGRLAPDDVEGAWRIADEVRLASGVPPAHPG
ncbi:MAG TPA: HDIG domain-containing protein [Chloroflexota bacterium]|nr:HDIG domain-containing protein [Chloroflexota bacterium]